MVVAPLKCGGSNLTSQEDETEPTFSQSEILSHMLGNTKEREGKDISLLKSVMNGSFIINC